MEVPPSSRRRRGRWASIVPAAWQVRPAAGLCGGAASSPLLAAPSRCSTGCLCAPSPAGLCGGFVRLTLDHAPGFSVGGMGSMSGSMTVAGLARRVGVRPDTVRYYERVGLLPAPPRTAGDHRRYDDGAVDLMRFIQGVQRLGLRLADIRELVEMRAIVPRTRRSGRAAGEDAAVLRRRCRTACVLLGRSQLGAGRLAWALPELRVPAPERSGAGLAIQGNALLADLELSHARVVRACPSLEHGEGT
jgi:DNA-binding transcriptional MerR regulator